MIKVILNKLIEGKTLTEDEALQAMHLVMRGEMTSEQLASFLSILRFRGETVEEMIGFARAMRVHMKTMDIDDDSIIDTCGTGGDGKSTFNISTTVAITLAALGVKVAKHGNRGVSSSSGSADVLEKLGVGIELDVEEGKEALLKKNLTFLYAPKYHSAMKYAAPARKAIGFRTLFNLLGPISNPANAKRQLVGIYDTNFAEPLAEVLRELGSKHVLFVTGRDGLDEISITDETDVVELKDGTISRFTISPEELGLKRGTLQDIQINSPQESAKLIKDIFDGNASRAATDIVVANAAAGLYIAGKVDSIKDGVKTVQQALQDGTVNQYFQSISLKKDDRSYA